MLEDRLSKGEVKVWDVETGRIVREFPGPALVTAISPDGRLAFAVDLAGYTRGKQGRQRYLVRDLATGETCYALESPAKELTFSPDGKRFACLNNDSVEIRETTTGIELLSLPLSRASGAGPAFRSPLSFSLDGRRLLLNGRFDSKFKLLSSTMVWFAPDPPGQGQGNPLPTPP